MSGPGDGEDLPPEPDEWDEPPPPPDEVAPSTADPRPPVTDEAGEVAFLRGVVTDLAQELERVAQHVTGLEEVLRNSALGQRGQVRKLTENLAELSERVLEAGPPAEEPAGEDDDEVKPAAWVDYATPEDWNELAEWVDWLGRTYDVQLVHQVLPCWPVHRGVAEELAALRTAWCAAALKGREEEPNDAMIYWHDRFLHSTITRARTEFAQKACEDGHRVPLMGVATDAGFLEQARTAAAQRDAAAGAP